MKTYLTNRFFRKQCACYGIIFILSVVWFSRLLLIATPESPNSLFTYPSQLSNIRHASGLLYGTTWSELWGYISPKSQDLPVLFSFSYVAMGALLPNNGTMSYALVAVLSLLIAVSIWQITHNLGGRESGLVALILATFSAYLMFEGTRLAPEIHAAAFYTLALGAITARRGGLLRWAAFGFCMAGALLSRHGLEPLLVAITCGVCISLPRFLWIPASTTKIKLFNIIVGPALTYITFWTVLRVFEVWAVHAGDSFAPWRFPWRELSFTRTFDDINAKWLWRLLELDPMFPFTLGLIATEPIWNKSRLSLPSISRWVLVFIVTIVMLWTHGDVWFRGKLVVIGIAISGALLLGIVQFFVFTQRYLRRDSLNGELDRNDHIKDVVAGYSDKEMTPELSGVIRVHPAKTNSEPLILCKAGIFTISALVIGLLSFSSLQWTSTEEVFLSWPLCAICLALLVGQVTTSRMNTIRVALILFGTITFFPAVYTVYRAKSNSVRARGFVSLHPQYSQQPFLGFIQDVSILQNIAQSSIGEIHVFGHPWRLYPAYVLDYPNSYFEERQRSLNDLGLSHRYPDQRDLLNSYILYESTSQAMQLPPPGTTECWTESEILNEKGQSIKISCHEYRGLEVNFPAFMAPGAIERNVLLKLPLPENDGEITVGFEHHVSAYNVPFGTVVEIDLVNDDLPSVLLPLDIYAKPPVTLNRPSNPGTLYTSVIPVRSNHVELEIRIKVKNDFVNEETRCPPINVYIRRPFAIKKP